MCCQPICDSALPNSYDPTGIAFMPDDVDTACIADTFEVKIFQRAPVAIITALLPSYLHNNPPN